MSKTKTREIYLKESKGEFSLFKNSKEEYNFEGISVLRQILSKEKARILDTIKYKKPKSIYNLAKTLNRPFKAVYEDLQLLDRVGFIDIIEEKEKNRVRHRPEIAVEKIVFHIKI